MLRIVVIEAGVVVLGCQILGDVPIAPGEVKLIAFTRTTSNGQPRLIGRTPSCCMFDPTSSQGQPLELARSDLTALESLWKHAPIVGDQNWEFRNQGAVAKFSFRHFDFSGQPQPAPLVDGTVVTVRRHHGAADMPSFAAVQGNPQQPQAIDTKTNYSIGIARFEVQHETLRPFFGFGRGGNAIAVVVIEVEVSHSQGGFAITQEVSMRLDTQGDTKKHRTCSYCFSTHLYGAPFVILK
ncbi:hypothetical protein D3C76_759980 [compost metagenome]